MVFSIIEGVQVVVANITHHRRLLRLLALLPFTKISKLGCAFCSYLAIITLTSYSLRRIEKMRQKPHFCYSWGSHYEDEVSNSRVNFVGYHPVHLRCM